MNHDPGPNRRSFLQWAIHGMGALFALVLGAPAVAYLLDARNRPARKGDFQSAARLSELPVGVPQQVVIRDVRRDAWTLYPNDIIGRVWLIRRDQDRVDAYTATCPHLGCSINYVGQEKLFVCPCHNGTWDLAKCEVVEREGVNNPAPRSMDSLEVHLVRDPDPEHQVIDPATKAKKDDQLVEVRYQNFIQGLATKEVKS
jgi:Rieske Fe-S protein